MKTAEQIKTAGNIINALKDYTTLAQVKLHTGMAQLPVEKTVNTLADFVKEKAEEL